MKYTVCILFDQGAHSVLLQKKSKTEFKGLLNGVGGKIELYEEPNQCAARKIKEEVNLDFKPEDLKWVGTLSLPHDCGTGRDEVCTLFFFTAIVDNPALVRQMEDEPVAWYDVDNIVDPRTLFPPLAGDGNLKYFIQQARKVVMKNAGSI